MDARRVVKWNKALFAGFFIGGFVGSFFGGNICRDSPDK